MIILVDSLNDAEYHKPDQGDSILAFITKVLPYTPSWMKWIVSIKSEYSDLLPNDSFSQINITEKDSSSSTETDPRNQDILEYITYRNHVSNELKANICMGASTSDSSLQSKFYRHLVSLSKGNFLYCKLALDLIEKGCLVLKTANFKILPINLHEVLLLNFNLKFPR